MNPLNFRTVTHNDISVVSAGMRAADVREVLASSGLGPEAALERAVSASQLSWTASDKDGPFCIFGSADSGPNVGCPWLLATDRLSRYRKEFLRVTPIFVDGMLSRNSMLINYVDTRHTESLRWLLWAGFKITKLDELYGVEQRPFFRFVKVRENV